MRDVLLAVPTGWHSGVMDARGSVAGPGLFDGLALLGEVADELVVRTVRDTHLAGSGRMYAAVERRTGGAATLPRVVNHGIAGAVYAGIGVGLRVASLGLGAAAATGRGPRLAASRPGRFLSRTVNGLIGDRLARERPALAWPMSLRRGGADLPADRGSLAAAYPAAGPDLVVFLPGLCEDESAWDRHADRHGTTYPEAVAAIGWCPLMLRVNTGLAVQDNGALLAALLADVVDAWPVEVERVALVGHSMGGLVARVACALDAAGPARWSPLVTDVVTLGTPHLGAPLAGWARSGSAGLARLPESAAFGRIIDQRSVGILDLERGLDLDAAPALPHARMRLVSGSLGRPDAPAGRLATRAFGDLLVRQSSATGGGHLFPDADLLHVAGVDHFGLLNHPDVRRALLEWLERGSSSVAAPTLSRSGASQQLTKRRPGTPRR